MSKQPVKNTYSVLNKYEDPVWDYVPDDAVFTKAYGVLAKIGGAPSIPVTRSPLELLRDYSAAWAEHGVSPPDLVFQTREEGLGFYNSVAVYTPYTLSSAANGMCIARVMGVNLIWPEE